MFARYRRRAERKRSMVGNSLRSDILPALAAGAWAVHIPNEHEWSHERAETPVGEPRFATLSSFEQLPGWLDRLVLQSH